VTRIYVQQGEIGSTVADAVVVEATTRLTPRGPISADLQAGSPPGKGSGAGAPLASPGEVVAAPGAVPGRVLLWAVLGAPGDPVGEDLLRASARHCLEGAAEAGARSLALPALGAGPQGLPLQRRAEILLDVLRGAASLAPALEEIRFVLESEPELRVFEQVNDAEKVRATLARMRSRPS
jgi:hypothetical protein